MDPTQILARAFHDALKVTACVLLTVVLLVVIASTCFAQASHTQTIPHSQTAMSQSTPIIYTPTYVGPDGAVGGNAAWEAGQAPYWYTELQRLGTDYIEAGIVQENPALINQGLLMLDWGWSRQGADGSFPGTGSNPITGSNATSATGGVFHTNSLFLEAAARAVLDLRAYHPVTYTLDPSTYAAKLAAYSAKLELSAQWLTNTAWVPAPGAAAVNVPALGLAFDMPYTHRFYLLASTLQQISVVTGDTTLVTGPNGANWWIDQAFPRQLGAGWQAAIPAVDVTGSNTPATLIPPGGQVPPNTYQTISAVGVNPERSGYDVSYHMVGCLHACRWYNASTDTARKAQVVQMLIAALAWERSRQSTSGVINTIGSTRVGVDETFSTSAKTKTVATTEAIEAFEQGGDIDGKGRDTLAGIRLDDANTLPTTSSIAASGAVGSNAAYDTNVNAGYNISLQKDCADWVQAGVLHENDAQIQQGLKMLAWGLARQVSNGSFPLTHSPYTDTCFFIEAASRCVLLLQSYHPISHPLNLSLLSGISSYVAAINSAAAYLMTPELIADFASPNSTSDQYLYAAALTEASVVTAAANPSGSASYQTQGLAFLALALAAQQSDGTNPEPGGVFSGNAQMTGVTMAERIVVNSVLPSGTRTQLLAAIHAALVRMEQVINIDGSFTYASPAVVTTQNAFQLGYTLTGDAQFEVIYQRIISSLDLTGPSGGGGGTNPPGGTTPMISADLGFTTGQPVFDIDSGTTVAEAGGETYLHIPMTAALAEDDTPFDLTQGAVSVAVIEFGQVGGAWQAGDWLTRPITPTGTYARLLIPSPAPGVYRVYIQTQGYSLVADGTIQFV